MKRRFAFFILILIYIGKGQIHARGLSNRPFISIDTLPTFDLINYLQQMNVQSYYGKPVDTFLLAIPANFYNMKVYGGSNSQGAHFRASYLVVDFTNSPAGPGVKIYVRQFAHLNKYSPNATWDIGLFRLETIHKIEIGANQNTCIN